MVSSRPIIISTSEKKHKGGEDMGQSSHLESEFKSFLAEMDAYRELVTLAQWDMRTKIPAKAVEKRSEAVGLLAEKMHEMTTSEKMKGFIDSLQGTEDPILQKVLRECEENYSRSSKIPNQEYREFVMLQVKSEAVWQEAREKDDFSLFQPYLEKMVEINIRFAEYWGYDKNRYDALLHNYEPGMTVETLDKVFPKVRDSLSSLLERIHASGSVPDTSFLTAAFPKQAQKEFSIELLKQMGYDFNAGRLDETIHPFAITLNTEDVRITTRYDENDFRMAVFGTVHEGGHALYEQNIGKEYAGSPLATGTSMGIHESQSLFWENFIARNSTFWKKNYETFLEYAPSSFHDVHPDEFYRSINEVKPSLIRIEADELTYPLHIMVRYELEKELINQEIAVKDLPRLWKEKMADYLGIEPPTDREGVLQDIHWAGGDFGYFPSYALGYMYAAQFSHTMQKQLDVEALLEAGDLEPIKNWLSENIHRHGKSKKPLELVKEVTGETLRSEYLIEYLTGKYENIYRI